MLENSNENLFLYVIVGAAIAMALLWFFVIAPIEKRNHERKLAILREKIKKHEEQLDGSAGPISEDENPND